MISNLNYKLFNRFSNRVCQRKLIVRFVQTLNGPQRQILPQLNEETDYVNELPEFVPVSHIKQFLSKRSLLYKEGFTCLSLDCSFCGVNNEAVISINKTSGNFFCIKCKKSGPWSNLEYVISQPSKISDIRVDESANNGQVKWLKLKKHVHPFSQLSEAKKAELLRTQIGLENLPLTKFESFDPHIDIKTDRLYFPLNNNNTVVGFKSLLNSEEITYPQNSACGIISSQGKSKSAVIVDNMKDLFTLLVYNLKQDLICLPHGEHQLPPTVLPLLEKYEKLALWLGGSSASWDNARMFARKLCSNRCYLVRPIENQTSVYEAHVNGKNVASIINEASCVAHPSIITFNSIRDDIAAELHNADKVSGVKWKRFPTLNSILKGHRRGELTILTGPTGSGKTTFISEYSLDLAMQKVITLWGSFEIRNQRLAKTMLQQMVLEPLEKNLNKFDSWADRFEQLPIYFMTFHGQQPLHNVLDAVQHATYVHDVSHVIIDNVQFMLGLSSKESGFLDRFSRQDQLIAAFRNFATMFNCHVTLVIHPRKERDEEPLTTSSIFGGAKASQEADNVLIIQHRSSHSSLKIKKFLQIAKNRFTGDLGMMPLEFDKNSLTFSDKESS